MGRWASRPINFFVLGAFLKVIREDKVNRSSILMQKAGLTPAQWGSALRIAVGNGLARIKGMGKHRGRRPFITPRGEEALAKISELMEKYSELLQVMRVGREGERKDKETPSGN